MILEAVTEDNYGSLTEAIIVQAVDDYRRALVGTSNRNEYTVRECERFFRSNYFELLTNLDPELIITRVRKEVGK